MVLKERLFAFFFCHKRGVIVFANYLVNHWTDFNETPKK